MPFGKKTDEGSLSPDDARELIARAASEYAIDGKRVLFLIPDHTRTCPIPMMFRALCEELHGRLGGMDFMVAGATHPPESEEAITKLVGMTRDDRAQRFPGVGVLNHEWKKQGVLETIGTISEDEVSEISGGLLRQEVPITVNRAVLDYDLAMVIGPTFPHEVAGFSGGNKYFFPGISGETVINFTHWLGALITNPAINGVKDTPVRRAINLAASRIPTPRLCMSMVVVFGELKGLFVGTPEEAFDQAADLSAEYHIVTCDRTYHTVLSQSPPMYDDIWTAGKCMYKLEPVVADGGELIIYAPHITRISATHGEVIEQVGYHPRDYFVKQWDKFKHHPWGILAHSTHVRGVGEYEDGVETCRVKVTLATQIPEELCTRINMGYRDPATINPAEYADREDEGILYVPKAGEMLHRLRGD